MSILCKKYRVFNKTASQSSLPKFLLAKIRLYTSAIKPNFQKSNQVYNLWYSYS